MMTQTRKYLMLMLMGRLNIHPEPQIMVETLIKILRVMAELHIVGVLVERQFWAPLKLR